MKTISKFGLLLAVALMACAAVAASAQAQVAINPPNTQIIGTADSPELNYAGTIVVCDTGTAIGTTGNPSDTVDVEVQFFGNCNVNGLAATVDCAEADVTRLRALTGDRGPSAPELGEVAALLPGFRCDVVVAGVCTITVLDQTLPISGGVNRADYQNEPADPLQDPSGQIDAEVDVNATRAGSSLCGPASGVGGFSGLYDLDPDAPGNPPSVTFD